MNAKNNLLNTTAHVSQLRIWQGKNCESDDEDDFDDVDDESDELSDNDSTQNVEKSNVKRNNCKQKLSDDSSDDES